jgi:hypothetical protein
MDREEEWYMLSDYDRPLGRKSIFISHGVGGGYSSPIFSMLKRPQPTPMSASRISSTRLTIVAPTALAIRLLSVFLTRRRAVTLALTK